MGFEADGIQGVLFFHPSHHQPDAREYWSKLFPEQDADGYQKAATNSPTLASTAHGQIDGLLIRITAQVGRLDLVASAPQELAAPSSQPPRLVNWDGATRLVAQLLKRIAAEARVFRAAMVIDLGQNLNPGQESAQILNCLPGFPFPSNVSDVSMQFNVPKPFSRSPDFQMNRLCSLAAGQLALVAQLAGNPQPGQPMMMSSFLGLKVDVNSEPRVPLAPDLVDAAIDELAEEALAISRDGVGRLYL